MSEAVIIQGRPIGSAELAQIRQWLAVHPDWSRHRLSVELARRWAWRNARGQLKDMAARTLLLKLEQRGWLALPPRRSAPFFNRMRPPPPPPVKAVAPAEPLHGPLALWLPLTLTEVSAAPGSAARLQFESLLQQHHYLGHRGPVGENLQYLATDPQGRPLAGVLFGAAAWQCVERDRYIGWDAATRSRHLPLLANNTRFLIPPWVRVPQLASHLLSRIARCVSPDWQAKYGHPIHLLETFVDTDRFAGTCYQAAGWIYVGQTQGRSRQDHADGTQLQVPRKAIYLYPLHPRFRERLQGSPAPPNPPLTPEIP
jgi:hypothetical protein